MRSHSFSRPTPWVSVSWRCGAISLAALLLGLTLGQGAGAAPSCSGNCSIGSTLRVGSDGGGDGSLLLGPGDRLAVPGQGLVGAFGPSRGELRVIGAAAELALGGVSGSTFGVGQGGGTGHLEVLDGALLTVDAFNNAPNFGDARFYLGRGGNGTALLARGGHLLVQDRGGFGADDDIMIGRSDGAFAGDGTLAVREGGQLTLRGNSAYLNVGNANLSFAGPEPGRGELWVQAGGRVRVDGTTSEGGFHIGRGDRSSGLVVVEGAGSRIDITGQFASLWVANAFSATSHLGSGSGRLLVRDGGVLSFQPSHAGAANHTQMVIGLGLGQGLVEVQAGGRIEMPGALRISNRLGTDNLQSGRLVIEEGGVVQATRTVVGDGLRDLENGVLSGDGLLIGALQVQRGGVVRPGLSPGVLTVQGNASFAEGAGLVLEVHGLGAGQSDLLNVQGNLNFGAGAWIELAFGQGYLPRAGDRLTILQAHAVDGLNPAQWRVSGVAEGFEFALSLQGGSLQWQALNDAHPVPEPQTWMLLLLGLAAFSHRLRKRAAR